MSSFVIRWEKNNLMISDRKTGVLIITVYFSISQSNNKATQRLQVVHVTQRQSQQTPYIKY